MLALLLVLGLVEINVPQANAALSGSDFVEEVTSAPSGSFAVAQDSAGRLFVIANNDVYRSFDAGKTWTEVLDGDAAVGSMYYGLFVDSRNYVFAGLRHENGSWTIYKSINNGASFTAKKTLSVIYEFDEFLNGTLTVPEIDAKKIWVSHDAGEAWSLHSTLWDDVTHLHRAATDDYTDDFWLCTGDGAGKGNFYKWTAGNWSRIVSEQATPAYQAYPILSDSKYVYLFGNGQSGKSYRMLKTGTSVDDLKMICDLSAYNEGQHIFALSGVRIGEVYLLGCGYGQIWASWDGEHWIKIFDQNTPGNYFRMFTQKGYPIYATESTQGKLYRVNLTKEDIIRLYYAQYNIYKGSLTNSASYVLEQRIDANAKSNYLDLTGVALTNVQATIKGLSQVNKGNANMGFEWGNLTGWSQTGSPTGTINSTVGYTYPAGSSCSIRVVKKSVDFSVTKLYNNPTGAFSVAQGEVLIVVFYAKASAEVAGNLKINFLNGTSTYKKTDTLTIGTSWARYQSHWIIPKDTPTASCQFEFSKVDCTTWVDSIIVYTDASNLARGWLGSESHQCITQIRNTTANPEFFTGLLNTLNPSLTVGGQVVSHTGTLTNNSASTATSLSGVFTGVVQVTASIQGTGQAILRLTATRILYEDSIIFKGYTSGVFYGRYYGTVSPIETTKDLVALTNLASNITSLTYRTHKLVLTINSPSGTTSTTKVCVGEEGEPESVAGATSYFYDASSRILTMTAFHSSSITITVRWRLLGDLNEDGIVNATDLSLLSEAFGGTRGPPPSANWNPNADLNQDNCTDVLDLYMLSKDYGKTNV